MRTPPLLLGAALLFWGWQSGYWIAAAGMAGVLESSRVLKVRWELTDRDFQRIGNFCAVLFAGAFLYALAANQGPQTLKDWLGSPASFTGSRTGVNQTQRAALVFVQLLPIVFFVIVAAQAFCRREPVVGRTSQPSRLPGSLSLRDLRTWPRTHDGSYPCFALCLLSASIGSIENSHYFFPGLCGLLAWALWRERSRRFVIPVWAGMLVAAMGIGFVGHHGLLRLYGFVQNYDPEWLTRLGRDKADAKESRTSLGSVGRLKLSGKIVLRLEPPAGQAPPPLLREASYRSFKSLTWYGDGASKDFREVSPGENETTWVLIPRATNVASVNIAGYLSGGRGLLALPSGVTRLEHLRAAVLKTNDLGAVRVEEGAGLVIFDSQYGTPRTIDSGPVAEDLKVPEKEEPALARVAQELNLAGLSPHEKLRRLTTFFQDKFRYSLLLSKPSGLSTNQTPLSFFLLEDRAGHCEYFATATVLLLRQGGIPARYAVGYSVQERSGHGYVVRLRHAHAWSLAYVGGAWQDFDTTPASWSEIEARNASLFEFLGDAWSRVWFEFTKFRYGQSGLRKYIPWFVVPVLVVSLARLLFGKQGKRLRQEKLRAAAQPVHPGLDSELYLIEPALAAWGGVRAPWESLAHWLRRTQNIAEVAALQLPLDSLLRLHCRYRFDPAGISADDREALRMQAELCLRTLSQPAKIG